MRVKKHMKLYTIRVYYHLKSIGLLFFVPLIFIDILIPLLNVLEYSKYGVGEELYINILQYSQWFMPLFSVWWIIFVLREYLESDGNELLYVHSNRCKLNDVLCIFFVYILNIAIIFTIYTALFPNMKYEFIKILSISILYLGIVYSFAYFTKSITITLMAILLYTLASIIFSANILVFPLYFTLKRITPSLYFDSYFPLAITGILLLVIGVVLNKKALKFV